MLELREGGHTICGAFPRAVGVWIPAVWGTAQGAPLLASAPWGPTSWFSEAEHELMVLRPCAHMVTARGDRTAEELLRGHPQSMAVLASDLVTSEAEPHK